MSTAIGYIIAFVLNYWVLRFFGFKPNLVETFWLTNIFTIASVLRGYYVRRLFNWLHVKELL